MTDTEMSNWCKWHQGASAATYIEAKAMDTFPDSPRIVECNCPSERKLEAKCRTPNGWTGWNTS